MTWTDLQPDRNRGIVLKPARVERITKRDIEAARRPACSNIAGPRVHVNAAMTDPLPPGGWQAAREGADDYLSIPSLGACAHP